MSPTKNKIKASSDGKTPVYYGKISKFYDWRVSMASELIGVKHAKQLLTGKVTVGQDGEKVT